MKKNTSNILILVLITIIFVVGGIYLMSRGVGNSPTSSTANIDPMHGGTITSSESLLADNLIDKPAPMFSLRDINGTEFSADSLKGKNIVLFFNEGIMCYPACWNQMVALATDPRLNSTDTVTLSVVIDQPSDWESVIKKMPDLSKATVLFDINKSVSRAFGMLMVKSSMHYGSYPGHSFVVIDKQGIVGYVFDDPNMGIDNERVFTELQKI